ncbi:MAG: hypothetical protein HZA17_05410 [Nitrospirae bacterium]|nr:hypothetical protein [Nitrospirota bacterium]
MAGYFLKEYGSWGVMTLSYIAGLLVSLHDGRPGSRSLSAFIAISLLINSKQALTLWLRSSGRDSAKAGLFFISQVVVAAVILVFLLGGAITGFLPYAIIPAIYILLLRFTGEHSIFTEVSGFSLLTLSSLIARFTVSGSIDPRLYAAVAVFFIAGVFKVRIQFKRLMAYRVIMVIYLAMAAVTYKVMNLPVIILIPLIDNLVFAIFLYRAKLQTTGWVEVAKGISFLLLLWWTKSF